MRLYTEKIRGREYSISCISSKLMRLGYVSLQVVYYPQNVRTLYICSPTPEDKRIPVSEVIRVPHAKIYQVQKLY